LDPVLKLGIAQLRDKIGRFARLRDKIGRDDIDIEILANSLRELQSLSFMYTTRMENNQINMIRNTLADSIKWNWIKRRGWSWMLVKYGSTIEIILSIMFKAVFTTGNSYDKLSMMRRFLPVDSNNLKDICTRIDSIRKEGIVNSAALARVFEEELLTQKKSNK
jgi:hypothetical protein